MLKSRIRQYFSWQRIIAFVALLLLIGVSRGSLVGAQAISTGYQAEENVQRGMIIRLKKDDTSRVEALKQEEADQMHGVVVNSNDAPATISDEGQKIFVATTGKYKVMVSSQAGSISPGDYVTISSLSGVGMKAGSKDTYVIGRALSAFDGVNNVSSSTELSDNTGGKVKVNLSQVDVDITVARNPLLKAEDPNVPEFLRRATEALVGKKVDAVRIYIAILVFIITTFLSGSLLYGGIRSAIISVGRNPLARKGIIRSMFQVVLSGLIVFTIGLFGVYLILKL